MPNNSTPLELRSVGSFVAASPFGRGIVAGGLRRLLAIDRLDDHYRFLDRFADDEIHERALEQLGIEIDVDETLLERIPSTGPVIVVANHPTGIAEGLALQALLRRRRADQRFMANGLLLRYPAFGRSIVAVDPFGGTNASRANMRGLKEAARWLESGGVLGVFPAGSVAALDRKTGRIEEGPWSDTIARLALRSGATVVPLHVSGGNSALFHVAGLVSPRLRTALLPRELFRRRGRKLRLRVGLPLGPEQLEKLGGPDRITEQLRARCLKLADPSKGRRPRRLRRNSRRTFVGDLPIMAKTPRAARLAEFERIKTTSELDRLGRFSVHIARAVEIPELLTEIGRLREISFRAVGEGTGEDCDLDAFDEHYLHLFVWDNERGEIAGAYRLRPTDDGNGEAAPELLYTRRLFGYDTGLLEEIGPALELGRSFVSADYQADYGTLHLLWKGIGAYLVRHPRYRSLIGAVSMSAAYREESRELLVAHLEANHLDPRLSCLVAPPHPFQTRFRGAWSPTEVGRHARDLREVSELIVDLEGDGAGVPVLWRHYLKLGARIAAFNVDPNFSSVVDGLIVVRLDETPMRHLQRYLGSDCAKILRGRKAVSALVT